MHVSSYTPPVFFNNGHIQTIFPVLFRKINNVHYYRERIQTPDHDFLDLDWSVHGHDRLAVISHGLEGSTHRAYVKGMVRAVTQNGWDALAWNYRSCSGEPNNRLQSYHNGATRDLDWVIRHAGQKNKYKEIALIGFSLGGNLTLLYLGREQPHPVVKKAVTLSVPCDLKGSAARLTERANRLYMKRFLIMLHRKIKAKMRLFPEKINDKDYGKIKDFKGFDDRYTAPIHGFKDAEDYWAKCSSKPYIPRIKIPTLIINALDDPFLSPGCFPVQEASQTPNVTLCLPRSGGHVGFVAFNSQKQYWSEQAAVQFLAGH